MALPLKPISLTASTLTLDRNIHRDATTVINKASTATVTLPAAVGSGDEYEVFIGATTTSGNHIIQVANTVDVIQGVLDVTADIAGTPIPTTATSDTITMNGGTTGGVLGSWIKLKDVKSGVWRCDGSLIAVGTEATPFSAAV
jgi:hypothetical protein